MTRTHLDPQPIMGPDNSTATLTPDTIPDTDFLNKQNPFPTGDKPGASAVPWPNSTYIIRSISSGHVITLRGGQVVLAEPGGLGNSHWKCVESKGWFGFQDPGSGRFLGHDKGGRLRCSAERHEGWENFHVKVTPKGGYVLLMTHWENLWHVGMIVEQGVEKLVKIGDGVSAGVVWEFLKV